MFFLVMHQLAGFSKKNLLGIFKSFHDYFNYIKRKII